MTPRSPASSASHPCSRPHCRSSASCAGSIVFSPVSLATSVASRRCSTRCWISGRASAGISDSRATRRRGRAGVGIDAGQPRNQAAAQQGQPREAVPRDRRVRVRSLEGALDRRLDRALDPSEVVVLRELELAAGVVFDIKPLQREGEQRQRILGAARLDVGEQRIDQAVLDLERACRPLQPPRRPLDHFGIGALRHGRQTERLLAHTFQFFGELQAFVVVRADRENGDDGGRVFDEQVTQQREEGLRLVLRLREEQLLALVDRQDQRGRLWLGTGIQSRSVSPCRRALAAAA